jgi:hypothetical protein
MQSHGVGVLYFSRDAETAISQSPLPGLCHDNQKILSGGRKPMTYMSLHLAMLACGSFNCWGIRKEFRQPVTLEEVKAY